MPYVMRSEEGAIVAVSQQPVAGLVEEVPVDDVELTGFITNMKAQQAALGATDQDFVRVLEDLVAVLVENKVIAFEDLPEDAQSKILHRQRLREALRTGA